MLDILIFQSRLSHNHHSAKNCNFSVKLSRQSHLFNRHHQSPEKKWDSGYFHYSIKVVSQSPFCENIFCYCPDNHGQDWNSRHGFSPLQKLFDITIVCLTRTFLNAYIHLAGVRNRRTLLSWSNTAMDISQKTWRSRSRITGCLKTANVVSAFLQLVDYNLRLMSWVTSRHSRSWSLMKSPATWLFKCAVTCELVGDVANKFLELQDFFLRLQGD